MEKKLTIFGKSHDMYLVAILAFGLRKFGIQKPFNISQHCSTSEYKGY